MKARSCISVLLCLVLAVPPALAAQKAKGPEGSETPAIENSGPMPVLNDIEEGWQSQNAALILRHFGANKVTISIDGGGPSGSYSKDQGYYLFKELFKVTSTYKFVFVQIRNSNEDGTASFAIAERRYQRRDDGRLVKDKVYIALHVEHDQDLSRWVLDEIKSIR